MTKDLTKLVHHIDEMRARLSQTAHTERSLVESLGDALNRLDQDMLQNIRNIAAGHEARRGAILNEIQALASSIGMILQRTKSRPTAANRDAHPNSFASTGVGPAACAKRDELGIHDAQESHLNGKNSHLSVHSEITRTSVNSF